jgi:hypothetical protein
VLPLGDQPKIVEPLSRALSAFTPPRIYRGIGSSWERGIL